MTCIAGLVERNNVYIGADSAGTNDVGQQSIRADAKVFRNGDMLFGCTSSFRMIQILRYRLVLPDYINVSRDKEDDPPFRYLVTDFIDAVRTCLKDGGYASKKDEQERGGKFLIGWRGRLFCIESDYQVEETICGYHAAGSGDDIALGILQTTQLMDLPPEQRIRSALEASAYHNANVRAPFLIKSIEYSETVSA